MSAQVPSITKSFVLGEKQTRTLENGQFIKYRNASVQEQQLEFKPDRDQIVVKVLTAGFNHRELWIRKDDYPAVITEGTVMGADGCGIVVAGPADLLNKRVCIVPMVGWDLDPRGPDGPFGILGGTSLPPFGTFSEYLVLDRKQDLPAPEHMSDEEVGAWGLGAVTAWRAVVSKAQIEKGQNVLITGIGGGVAIISLFFCVALGANVFVSSSSKETIEQSIKWGAKGGVNYRDESWPTDLAALLKEHNSKGLDAIIDSAGGDLLDKTMGILNHGAKVVCFGMTTSLSIPFTLMSFIKNIDLLGSTMGSTAELRAANEFATKHGIRPIVSTVLEGIDNAEKGFELLAKGRGFGKIVVRVNAK
ncbi:Zinc-binding dehydrogenase family oxidoreductase [Ceratobasidium theobromae]|uniref:Zinc-binding dehydrogenase family oxidoreductase n=1 Tax=Ceratobasidium theobromae TaxID=1582974 RepID=A0A5N5QK84_9AGAM|nr:Zinc-binding dehydrogenase family oxidoreductase [Ceratobasidium theobromae]